MTYQKHDWIDDELIAEVLLDHVEQGIYDISSKIDRVDSYRYVNKVVPSQDVGSIEFTGLNGDADILYELYIFAQYSIGAGINTLRFEVGTGAVPTFDSNISNYVTQWHGLDFGSPPVVKNVFVDGSNLSNALSRLSFNEPRDVWYRFKGTLFAKSGNINQVSGTTHARTLMGHYSQGVNSVSGNANQIINHFVVVNWKDSSSNITGIRIALRDNSENLITGIKANSIFRFYKLLE